MQFYNGSPHTTPARLTIIDVEEITPIYLGTR
jgi:hypothetical protein